jgi:NTP pyrophosphatase (non-canonical NTP hydrolase)
MTTSNSDSAPIGSAPGAGSRDSEVAGAIWSAVRAALPSLRSLQLASLGIYGRLEPDRALVWTIEELGELAQAVRRKEGRARLEEELGQLTTWMLCLANILDVDLAAAVESAIREEIDRQLVKYGRLTPFTADRAAR